MRKLTKTIVWVSLMTPASVLPLGIGDIKLHSALNQNLKAEIPVSVSPNENVDDIKVKLAPPDKFDEAGVPWSYFLSKIKFKLDTRPDGKKVIKLTSSEALSEPFLDFLLQVTWPKGNLYREFTVLVDPPASYQQPVIPVATSPAPAQAERSYRQVVEQSATPAATSRRSAITEYGPVRSQDTLWKIAEKVNPYPGVSVEQTMMALYHANRQAFYQDNVNALAAGAKLKVPDREVLLKLSRKQALAEFSRQMQAWNHPAVPVKPESEKTLEVAETQLKLLAPTQADVAADEMIAGTESENPVPAPTNVETTAEPQEGIAQQSTDADLEKRLQKLEQQLAAMQQLLTLKDQQLAALQNKSQESTGAAVSQPANVPMAVGTEKPQVPALPEQPKAQPKPEVKPQVQSEPEAEGWGLYYWLLGLFGIGGLGIFGWLWYRKQQIDSETDTESMFAASSEISLPESADSQISVQAVEDGSSYDVGTVGESSFLSEFTPSDFDAFESDQHEVDPISEADVYLAYGRYQQAEELIRHAIDENPENDEYKLKLLEIYYVNENKEAFENYAETLIQQGKRDDEVFWEKVVEMGTEISPGAALFSSDFEPQSTVAGSTISPTEQATEEADVAAVSETDTDNTLDFDLSSFEAPALEETEASLSGATSDNSLDFDLSAFDLDNDTAEQKASGTETAATENHEHEIDFDLSANEQEPDAAATESLERPARADDDIESFDFDFGLPESETSSDEDKREHQDDGAAPDELDAFFDHDSDQVTSEADTSSIGKDEDFDFNFDLDSENAVAESEDGKTFSDDWTVGVSDLTDMDEFETKIDLARAYIDMGDSDAAKDIAEEVLEKGSTEQKEAAQAIIAELK